MRRRLLCMIESLADERESFWHIAIRFEDIPDAITLLTALRLGKLGLLVLVDVEKKQEAKMQMCYDSKKNIYTIEYAGVVIQATDIWVDAVLSLLAVTWVAGWAHLAHIDQDFTCSDGVVSLCVSVLPPAGDS